MKVYQQLKFLFLRVKQDIRCVYVLNISIEMESENCRHFSFSSR